jgi:hypothetical protein
MAKEKTLLWRLLLPLAFWGIIALLICLLPAVPKEPDQMPLENWSYYGPQAPLSNQVLKYRTELLFIILLCAIVTELVFFFYEQNKKRKKK